MTTLYAVAGQKLYIGSAAVDLQDDDLVEADFSAVTWIEIKHWTQMGAIGDAAALITTPLIDRARDYKQKGTRNAGQMQNIFVLQRADAGQAALIAAEATDLNYPFKLEGNDEPAVGSNPTPSIRYFHGLVMSAQEAGGGANTAQTLNSTIEINSNIVVVNASAGAAPVNTVLPAISGVLTVGEVLTAYDGVWTGGVDSYTYQWKRGGVDIGGATSKTYTLVVGDQATNISVVVTATNTAGSTSATSPETDVVA